MGSPPTIKPPEMSPISFVITSANYHLFSLDIIPLIARLYVIKIHIRAAKFAYLGLNFLIPPTWPTFSISQSLFFGANSPQMTPWPISHLSLIVNYKPPLSPLPPIHANTHPRKRKQSSLAEFYFDFSDPFDKDFSY